MLKLESVSVYYGGIRALWDISLNVEKGSITALIGANGAGKTTTLKSIIGLVPIKSGKIIYNGKDISRLPPHKRVRMGISICPEGRQLFYKLTVKENLLMGAYTLSNKDEFEENLKFVYKLFPLLKEREDQIAGTLSGGEQQMVAIGRALITNPKLLLMDEPSLGLAPFVIKKIYDAIKKINQEGVTILLVEQNALILQKIVNYVYVLENGHIIMEGEPDKVIKLEEIKKAYLGG